MCPDSGSAKKERQSHPGTVSQGRDGLIVAGLIVVSVLKIKSNLSHYWRHVILTDPLGGVNRTILVRLRRS